MWRKGEERLGNRLEEEGQQGNKAPITAWRHSAVPVTWTAPVTLVVVEPTTAITRTDTLTSKLCFPCLLNQCQSTRPQWEWINKPPSKAFSIHALELWSLLQLCLYASYSQTTQILLILQNCKLRLLDIDIDQEFQNFKATKKNTHYNDVLRSKFITKPFRH